MSLIVQVPQVYMPGYSSPEIQHYTASSHCNAGDIVVLSGGQIAPATANQASGIVGVATCDSNANYGAVSPGFNTWYGTPLGGPLVPGDAAEIAVATFYAPSLVQMYLTSTTGWITGGTQQVNYGSLVGLAIQNGVYVADPTASNKVAEIVELAQPVGPSGLVGGSGQTGLAVLVRYIASTLA